jgi:glycosyltransferase involved in cell wall biosynthesis
VHIIFVTRKYPPSTGGMENAALELYASLAASHDVTLIKWGGSNKALPVVYPWLFVQALWHGLSRRPDVIYMQDGLMGPMGWLLKTLLRRPTLLTIHGKEATYANPIYKLIVTPFISRQSQLVVVSNETKDTVEKALPGMHPAVIYNGLRDSFFLPRGRGEHLAVIAHDTGIPLEQLRQSKILHTHGRLVRRKGVLWFVDNVLPHLEKSVLYLVSGDGKDREVIQTAIAQRGLSEQVKLLGRVSDKLRDTLYNVADLFVMPNVPIANDMEGFGLVALEAASCGTMVVASDLEGIKDAIIDGKNGVLVKPGDANKYIEVINRELKHHSLNPGAVRDYTLSHYSWDETAAQYATLMQQLVNKH